MKVPPLHLCMKTLFGSLVALKQMKVDEEKSIEQRSVRERINYTFLLEVNDGSRTSKD